MGLLDDAADRIRRARADAAALEDFQRRHPNWDALSQDPPPSDEYEDVVWDLLQRVQTHQGWVVSGPHGGLWLSREPQRDALPARYYSLYVGEKYEGDQETNLLLVRLDSDGRILHRGHWSTGGLTTFVNMAAQAAIQDTPKPPKRTGIWALILGPD